VVTEGGNHPELVTSLVTTPIPDEDEPVTGNRTLAEAHRQREWIRVQKDQLDLKRKRGELAPIGEVNAFVAGQIIRAREILMRIGPELKDRLAQQSNPHECEQVARQEIERALNELRELRPAQQS